MAVSSWVLLAVGATFCGLALAHRRGAKAASARTWMRLGVLLLVAALAVELYLRLW